MKRFLGLFLMLLVLCLFVSSVYAETKIDYGAAFRLRQEIWDNVTNFSTSVTESNKDRNFFRLRTTLWGKADFTKDYGMYMRIVSEPKYYTGPFRPNAGRATDANNDRLDENEVIIDNLYFDAKNVFGLPVDLRIGRQDLMYGEGFLIQEGTPNDGSRTFYFNAAKATWNITKDNSVDFVLISDPNRDTYLPSLYTPNIDTSAVPRKVQLNASNEKAIVVYSKNKIDNLTVEPYYIYKRESAFSTTPGLNLNTFGARVVYDMNGGWKFGGEYAHQFGQYTGGRDRKGDGGYAFVGRKYENVTWKPEFDLRYIYLSGDKNPSDTTGTNEAWNPLFSRAPYWNELLIYSLPNEQAANGGLIPGYWSNMQIYKASVKANFDAATNLTVGYQYLRAVEATSASTTMFTNSGKERGHMPSALLYHQFSKKVDGFLQYEYFMPEGFYKDTAKNATFFRWQLQVKI